MNLTRHFQWIFRNVHYSLQKNVQVLTRSMKRNVSCYSWTASGHPRASAERGFFFYVYLFMHLFILLPNTRINVKGRFHSLCLFVYPSINLSINSHVHPVTRRHVKSFFIPSVYLLIFSFIYSFTNSSICVFLLCSSVLKSLKRKNCFIPLSFTLG